MEKKLIELRKKLLFATKCIREHNDPMAADTVIEFSLTLINSMLEKSEKANDSTSESVLPIPCVSGSLPLADVDKCGKCDLLGELAPCDECYFKGNNR